MNVEITGIPVTANENCKNIVANVGNLMGLDVDSNYFDVAIAYSKGTVNMTLPL